MKVKMKKINKKILITAGIICVLFLLAVILSCRIGNKEEVVYKETRAAFGNLVVGVTEKGSVDIGTVEQTFDLDMSALQRVDTANASSGADGDGASGMNNGMPGIGMSQSSGGSRGSGGLDLFNQIFDMADGSNVSSSGSESTLEIADVRVSVGQQVSTGDVLYELEEESASELQEQLQSNVEKAKADLEAVYADQELSGQTARYTYESSIAYGSYANMEYQSTLQQLQEAVDEAEEALEQAKALESHYLSQLEELNVSYKDALQVLENCKWGVENTDKQKDVYAYVEAFQTARSAQSTADTLEQQVEQLERNVEQAAENVERAEKAYHTARRNLEQGKLSAVQTLSLRNLAYNTAQETYDIAMAYLEEDAATQETIYEEAMEKWEEYSSQIKDGAVCSEYDGVITGVELAAGDSIRTGTTLVTLYNMDEVTMTVTVDESDRTSISMGDSANVLFTAYPDTPFEAQVTYISEASADKNGKITYEVTVTLQGDVSSLFQGMTGEVTFITEETRDVLYISRRALLTEGENTYVKVRNENGDIEKRKVTTGFTDGTNVEIVEGLSEGETVLIESKVSGS